MGEQQGSQTVGAAARRLGRADAESLLVLTELWETAFEEGRLAALDEFQDRFCVCMK